MKYLFHSPYGVIIHVLVDKTKTIVNQEFKPNILVANTIFFYTNVTKNPESCVIVLYL